MLRFILSLTAFLLTCTFASAQQVSDNYQGEIGGVYRSVDGVLYCYSTTSQFDPHAWILVKYPSMSPQESYVVNPNCQRIARGAFSGAKNLRYIVIPSSVYWIGDNAFEGCTNLEAIIIGDSLDDITSVVPLSGDESKMGDVREVARYNLSGQRCTADEKGIQIVLYSDGTSRTVQQ